MHKILTILLLTLIPAIASAGCADDVLAITNADPDLSVSYTYQYNPFAGLFVTVWIVDSSQPAGSQVICLNNGYNNPEAVWCAVLACLEDYLGL